MAFFAIGNVLFPFSLKHLVEIFHPGRADNLMAGLALHRLVFGEVRHVFEIGAFLVVAVDTSHSFMDRTMEAVAANKYRLAGFRLKCVVRMTIEAKLVVRFL